MVALSDTSSEARKTYFRRLSEMTPSERLRIGAALWSTGHALQRAAASRGAPGVDESDIMFRVATLRFGLELARKAYGCR